MLLSITHAYKSPYKSPIPGYVLSVIYEHNKTGSYPISRLDKLFPPAPRCQANPRAVTKVTAVNINCKRPLNDNPYILLH